VRHASDVRVGVYVSSPGHSVGVFVHLSTMIIAISVLVRGVDTAWAPLIVFTRLCQVQLNSATILFLSSTTKEVKNRSSLDFTLVATEAECRRRANRVSK